MLKPDISTLEAMVAEAETKTYEKRSGARADSDERRDSRERCRRF